MIYFGEKNERRRISNQDHVRNFPNLVDKFLQGISKAEDLAKSIDLHKPLPAWSESPVIQAFMVLLQHNSYHLGQLITTRKSLGLWDS